MSKEIQLFQILCAENTTVDMVLHFFRDLKECCPNIYPEKMNDCEPVNKPFSADKKILEPYINQGSSIFLVNRKAKAEFSIFMKQNNELANRHTTFECKVKKAKIQIEEQYKKLLKKTSSRFDTDFAFIHTPLTEERHFGIENDTMERSNYFFVHSPLLQKYIPDLYTCTVFGGRYISHFGMEKLLSMPAPVVEKISDTQVYFQLVKDTMNYSFEEIDESRKKIKKHLGINSFFQLEKGKDYKYDHPDFGPEWIPAGTTTIFIG